MHIPMMFAYQENPEAFGDAYNAAGLPEANGIPDIVDEIKWGLDWLNRMNPAPGERTTRLPTTATTPHAPAQ